MMFWFVMALMTAAAIFAVLWPLARRTPLRSGSDVAVYRDQLDEIERDRAAGLIAGREAEAARIEVSRRLLAAADTAAPAWSQDGTTVRRRAAALAALILLPLGAASLYLSLARRSSRTSHRRRGATCPPDKARSWNWSPASRPIWSRIRTTVAAGRCSGRFTCGSGAMTTR
jgi:cytochrome c-type biogenesis protein CcmI